MGNSILIVVAGSILLFGIANIKTFNNINKATENSVAYYSDVQARNICNTTVEMLLSKLFSKDSSNYRTTSPVTQGMFGGTTTYAVTKSFFNGDSLIKITVDGVFAGVSRRTVVYTGGLGGWVPPFIRGAWTANGNLNNTISDMYIDGRDHFTNCWKLSDSAKFTPKTGNYAVSTTVPFVNTDGAFIGGTSSKVDYQMSFPHNPAVIELYNWGGNFPKNPDGIFGYPVGTLKTIAQSGVGGSQYRTSTTTLTWPLKGVTFIELPSANEVELQLKTPPLGQVNKGILIVHRVNATSKLKGLKAQGKAADPPFVGLIVTDYSFHHHLDILGAMIQLSPNLNTKSTCNGNKEHFVFYSSQAIIDATRLIAENSGYAGNNTGGDFSGSNILKGMGARRYSAAYWYE